MSYDIGFYFLTYLAFSFEYRLLCHRMIWFYWPDLFPSYAYGDAGCYQR